MSVRIVASYCLLVELNRVLMVLLTATFPSVRLPVQVQQRRSHIIETDNHSASSLRYCGFHRSRGEQSGRTTSQVF